MKIDMRWRPLLAALALLCAPLAQAADPAPARPPRLTIVVPYSHGGPTDELARILAEPLGRALQRKVVERNVVGAGGTLGAEKVSKAKPDGSTLLLSNIGHATSATLFAGLRYDPLADFEPIGLVADVPMTLVGRRDLAARDVRELLRDLRGGMRYAHAGVGSASHLCGLLLGAASGGALRMVAYPGTAEALADLAGGHVDLVCDQPTHALKALQAGKVRGFAVTGPARLDILPALPTLREGGLQGVELVVWHGLYAPRGTPPEVVEALAAGLSRALADPALQVRMRQLGAAPASAEQATPAALRSRLQAEAARWQPVLREAAASGAARP